MNGMRKHDLAIVGMKCSVWAGSSKEDVVRGKIVGYGTNFDNDMPQPNYIVKLDVGMRAGKLYISTIVAHPDNMQILVDCEVCGDEVNIRDSVKHLDSDQKPYWLCLGCEGK